MFDFDTNNLNRINLGRSISIAVVEICGGDVRLRIEAPNDVLVYPSSINEFPNPIVLDNLESDQD